MRRREHGPPQDAAAGPAEDGLVCVPAATGSDELVVRGSGAVAVATDALLAHAAQLQALAAELHDDAVRAGDLSAQHPAGAAHAPLEASMWALWHASDRAGRLAAGLVAAQDAYARAELFAMDLTRVLSDWAAVVAGDRARKILPFWLATGPLRAWVGERAGLHQPDMEEMKAWLEENPQVYTNPQFVELLRRAVSGADDFVLGAAGMPPMLALLLGPHGFGVLGVDASARALMTGAALSGAGVLRETPVAVTRTGQTTQAPARGAVERFDRIPREEEEHVRIELIQIADQEPRYVVYIAPTKAFEPAATGEPWDLTSNVAAIADLSPGSLRAVELAMADAGIGAHAPVVFVGYSQGALIADRLAASGNWNTVGLETWGGPMSTAAVPPDVAGLAIRHTDDPVTALGGPDPADHRMIVERRAFRDGESIPSTDPFPSHQRAAYRETAELVDAARSPEVREQLDALDGFVAGHADASEAEVTVFTYRAERVPPPEPAPEPARARSVSASSS